MPSRTRLRQTIQGVFNGTSNVHFVDQPTTITKLGVGGSRGVNNVIHLRNTGNSFEINCTTDTLTLTGGQAGIGLGDITAITDALTLTGGTAFVDTGQYEAANTWFNDSWWPAPFWESAWWPTTTAPTVDTGTPDTVASELGSLAVTVSFETNGETIQSVTNTGDAHTGLAGPFYFSVLGTVYTYLYTINMPDGSAGTGPFTVETTIVTDGGTVADSFTLTVIADIEAVTDSLTLTVGQAGIYSGTSTTTDTLVLTTRRANINGFSGGPSRAVRAFGSWRGYRG